MSTSAGKPGHPDAQELRFDLVPPELPERVCRGVRERVHERDQHVCRFCGLQSRKYQQVVVAGGNWRDLDAIVTACIFCQQVSMLDAAHAMRSGVLVTLPEYSQVELNRVAVELYAARITTRAAPLARACLDYVLASRPRTRDTVGTDDPARLAVVLRSCKTSSEREKIKATLAGVRLFPLDRRIVREAELEFNQFPQILAFWRSRSGPLAGCSTSGVWPRLERFCSYHGIHV